MELTPELVQQVADLLGRQPRGLEDIPVSRPDGTPMVIRVASLVDDKPFPTLFWLIDRELCYRIDQAEAAGLIRELQGIIDKDPGLQERMREDNRAYIRLREGFISDATRHRLQQLGFGDVLPGKGIGGIADFTRIRCLHTWYAAHLVVPNTVGDMLDDWWQRHSSGA